MGDWRCLHRLNLLQTRRTSKNQSDPSTSTERPLSQEYAVTKSIVVEFHEAQCFFILATQVAVLISSMSGPVDFGGSTNYCQLQNNARFAVGLGIGGQLNITFTLFVLLTTGMTSWYLFLLSGITLTIATIAIFNAISMVQASNDPDSGFQQELHGSIPFLDSCGSNPPPNIYCCMASDYGGALEIPLAVASSIFCLIVLVSVFLLAISATSFSGGLQKGLTQSYKAMALYFGERKPYFLILIVEFLFLTFFVIYIYYYLQPQDINFTAWPIGQIIAVFVWAPVVGKYVYWVICKSPIITNG
jgi:hypothetical protein